MCVQMCVKIEQVIRYPVHLFSFTFFFPDVFFLYNR